MAVIIGLLSAWLKRSYGVYYVYWAVSTLLSGSMLPIDMLPAWIGRVSAYFPFIDMVYTPSAMILGSLDGPEIHLALMRSIIWLFFLWWLLLFVWRRALPAFEGEGI
jgi:ABC-2 type transport system permease protein